MSRFFTNIINRNIGTCEVVQPRPLARFEPESAEPAITSAVGHAEASETEGNEQIRQDRQYWPAANNPVVPEDNSPERDPHFSTPLFQEQEKPIIKPKPAEKPSQKGGDASRPIVHPQSELVSENQRPLSEDLPKRIAEHKPNEKVNEHTNERGYCFESELDNRIRATLTRLQGRLKGQPTEQSETNSLPRPVITEPDHADAPQKDRTVQPLSSTNLFDEPEKVGPSASDQGQQQAIASTDRDMPGAGALEPPSWLSEMQTEFNQRWNELNRRPAPEPVINVTIGRVEVRAVQADTPKQTKGQKKPTGVMSLDEYLKQRERKG